MNLRSLFSLFSSDLAIDLGTANTLVYADTYSRCLLTRRSNIEKRHLRESVA